MIELIAVTIEDAKKLKPMGETGLSLSVLFQKVD
jgi:hypothetical protein